MKSYKLKAVFLKRFFQVLFFGLIVTIDLKSFEELSLISKGKTFLGGKDESNIQIVNGLQEPTRKFLIQSSEFENNEASPSERF